MGRKSVPETAARVFAGFSSDATATLEGAESVERIGRFMKEVTRMDPRRIIREGPYVRHWHDEADDRVFREGARETGEIHTPIAIREVGDGPDVRYALVYGGRRLQTALDLDFEEVPVRNYGPISEAEAVLLQGMENEHRQQMHHVDRALMYHAMVEHHGFRQAQICRAFGKDDGQVSVLCRTGAAISELSDDERNALYASPRATVRAFQEIAKLPLGDRVEAVRMLVSSEPNDRGLAKTGKGRGVTAQAFEAKDLRGGGRRFSFRWTRKGVKTDPSGYASALVSGISGEVRRLIEGLADTNDGGTLDIIRRLERAESALQQATEAGSQEQLE